MANFFTRPQLDDRQFKQLSGDTLNLSGLTNFAGVLQSKGVEIDGTVTTGTTVGSVLTYNGSKILLLPASGGSGVYDGASPSNITVGGMPAGTTLTGRTIVDILEEILIDTFDPTLTAPNNSFSDNQANTQEVGITTDITFTASFSRGAINPQFPPTASPFRSGPANTYNYTGTGLPANVSSSASTDIQTVTGYTILLGSNQWTNSVDYDAGVQPYNSDGDPFNTPLPAGNTGNKTVTITGIYPYFFGTFASGGAIAGANRPDPATSGQTLIDTATKVVASSTGTITVNFNSTSDDYLFFATPETSTTKTRWFVDALNTGDISGPDGGANLFPAPTIVNIDSPTTLWSGVNYKIYISNFQSAISAPMQLRNS
jgi:hypothetical protein